MQCLQEEMLLQTKLLVSQVTDRGSGVLAIRAGYFPFFPFSLQPQQAGFAAATATAGAGAASLKNIPRDMNATPTTPAYMSPYQKKFPDPSLREASPLPPLPSLEEPSLPLPPSKETARIGRASGIKLFFVLLTGWQNLCKSTNLVLRRLAYQWRG